LERSFIEGRRSYERVSIHVCRSLLSRERLEGHRVVGSRALADVSPVFLFDVSVIIFVIGTASGELDGLFSLSKMFEEVMVEELRSVVTIEAQQGERQAGFDIFDLLQDIRFSFSPDGSLFGPAGGDVDASQSYRRRCHRGILRNGDGIGFEEAGVGLIPLVGLDGDMFSEKGSWFGSGAASFLVLDTDGT